MKIRRKQGASKNGKPRLNNIGPWLEKLLCRTLQRAARLQCGPEKLEPKTADDGPWVWPIYHVDVDAISAQIKREFVAKEKGKTRQKPAPKKNAS
jgi:hypothetical protein